jgi:hypothetical protein
VLLPSNGHNHTEGTKKVTIESIYNEIENQIENLRHLIVTQTNKGQITSAQSGLMLEQLQSTLFAIEQALTTKEGSNK